MSNNVSFRPMLSDITMKINPGGAIWCGPSRVLRDQILEINEIFIPGIGVKSLQSIVINSSDVTRAALYKMAVSA